MNTTEFGASPIPPEQVGTMARGTGDCGTVGILLMSPAGSGGELTRLMYQDITNIMGAGPTALPELVIDGLSPPINNASLFFAANCMATVMRPTNTGYMQYDRSEGGIWAGRMVKVAGNEIVTDITTLAAWQQPDGTMKLIARAQVGSVTRGLIGTRTIEPYSTWNFTRFDLPSVTDLFSIKEAPDGTIHAVYSKTSIPCDPCDMGLYHGTLPMDGQWSEDLIQESKWGDPNDEYATDAALAIDSNGHPLIAATYFVRAITGSIKSAQLRLYGSGQSGWCNETVVTEVDGYAGSDGTKMTGISPSIFMDTSDRPHVVFMDKAQWHDGNNWANAIDGQIRYAVRNGRKWTVRTLLTQDGQTISPSPLIGALPPSLAISPDGTSIHAATATFEWDTDSIYLQQETDITFKATAIQAESTLP
ncbi:MAG TPA: hypothetical protein PLC24_07260 [Myxococcota bacterium]|nr:hypothetical protein [Myxococcota bacterium]